MDKTFLMPPGRSTVLILSAILLSACGSESSPYASLANNGTVVSPGSGISLSVIPEENVVAAGGDRVALKAQVADGADLADVTWVLEAGSPGRLDGDRGATVNYVPPPAGSVSGKTVIHIEARLDGVSKSLSLVLEGDSALPPAAGVETGNPDLTIISSSDHTTASGPGITLNAQVSASGEAITWSIEGEGVGSLDRTSGDTVVYTPPANIASTTAVTVVARSAGKTSKTTLSLQGGAGLTVLAGNDFGEGMRDGAGAGARFSAPYGLARDSAGNVFVADTNNHTIRKIAPDSTVTTVAGMPGVSGHVDGVGQNARFNMPRDITIDSAGNLFLADGPGHTLRRITTEGEVSTVAGTPGVPGDADGTGSAAQFNRPVGIATGGADALFVADMRNSLVRKSTTSGTVNTYAGIRGQRNLNNGSIASATFIDPFAITVDAPGNVYVSDGYFSPPEPNTIAGLSIIRKITPDGNVGSLAGGFLPETQGNPDGTGSAARFFQITDMVADGSGNLYVGDGRIRRVDPAGVVTTYLPRAAGQVNYAGGVTLDPTGTLYFTDIADHVVRSLAPGSTAVTLAGTATLSGSADGVRSAAQFHAPKGIATRNGQIYVTDTLNHTIRRITPSGVVSTLAGSAGEEGDADGSGASARFYYPQDLVVDANGNVYVADSFNEKIRKISPAGVVTTFAGSGEVGSADGPGSSASFNTPHGIVIDANGNLYVSDRYNHVIRKITPEGVVSTLAGSPQQFGSADGAGAAARFNAPGDMSIDEDGNLYVLDAGSTIRMVTPEGVVTTLAGASGVWGSADGAGSVARFRQPEGITLGEDGALYVADTGNHAIRRVGLDGTVTTVAGNGAANGFLQGVLYRPEQLTVTAPGTFAITASNGVFRLALP